MPNVATIFIDGEILPENYIWPEETATSLHRVRQQVQAAGEFDSIQLNIFSPGGYCLEGWAIVDYLLALGKPINTLAYGQCASFGTVLHTLGTVREVSQHCDYVIHRPWDFFIGNDIQIDEQNANLKKETLKLFEHYAVPTGKTVAELAALIQKEDLTLTPMETVTYGFSTAIYTPSASARASLTSLDDRKKKPSYLLTLKDRKPYQATNPVQTTPKTMAEKKQSITGWLKSIIAGAESAQAVLEGTETKNLDNQLKDGRVLVTDSIGDVPAIGDAATIDGAAAPNGDYELENGTVVSVADGKVSNVQEPAPIDPANPSASDNGQEQPVTAQAFAAMQKENEDLRSQIKALKDKQEKFEARMSSVLGQLKSQDPLMMANNQPADENDDDKPKTDREEVLKAHVAKYKPKKREVVK